MSSVCEPTTVSKFGLYSQSVGKPQEIFATKNEQDYLIQTDHFSHFLSRPLGELISVQSFVKVRHFENDP